METTAPATLILPGHRPQFNEYFIVWVFLLLKTVAAE